MKAAAPPRKVKSALNKLSQNKVSKKTQKDGLGKKKGALLALAAESLTTPEKKIIAKSLKMKKSAEPSKASKNYVAKSPLVSKSLKETTLGQEAPVVAKSLRTKKKNSAASSSLKKVTVLKSDNTNSPVVTKSLKKATDVPKSPAVKSARTLKKQKMNVVANASSANSPTVDKSLKKVTDVPKSAVVNSVRKSKKQKMNVVTKSPEMKKKNNSDTPVVAMSPNISSEKRARRSRHLMPSASAESSGMKIQTKSLKISQKSPVQKKIRGKKQKVVHTKKLRLKQKKNIKLVAEVVHTKKLRLKQKKNIKLEAELLKGACASALTLINKGQEGQGKKDLFGSLGQPVYLQLTLFKVPETPKRDLRIPVPNSIYSTDPDVLLIVPDIKRGRFRDVTFAKYMEEYEEKLMEAGIKGVKQIIPFTQLRAENNQFELKRRLVLSYDIIACDARLSGHCTHFLGPALQKCNKFLTPLKVTVDNDSSSNRRNFQFSSDLQRRLDLARLRAFMTLSGQGTSLGINLGHTQLSAEQLADNVQAVWTYLGKHLPGGLRNIKSAYLKGAKTLPVPIYASLAPLEKVPVVKPKKPKYPVEDEISTLPGFTTIVDSSGGVKVVNRQTAEDQEFFKAVLDRKASNKRSNSERDPEPKRIKKNNDGDDDENDVTEDGGEVDLPQMTDTATAEEEYLKNWAESAADLEKEQQENQGKAKSKRRTKNKKGSDHGLKETASD